MRKVSLSLLMVFSLGILIAQQDQMPSKGRFDVYPQPSYRQSRLDDHSKDATRTQVWSTNFANSTGWELATGWSIGTPTMGPAQVPDEVGCLGTNLSGYYLNNSNIRAVSPVIHIPEASFVELHIGEWFELESNYDFGWVEIKQQNTYYSLDARSGTSGGEWRETAIEITRWQGSDIQLVFHLTSDSSVPGLGWYIDSASIDMVAPFPLSLDISGVNISNLPSVYLTAAVSSPSGPVTDLGQSNFSLWENSQQQQNLFTVTAPDNSQTASSTDIVFVLDVTGSMGNEISSVRANMQAFMNNLENQNMDYRIGFVVFGDIVYVYNQYMFYSNFPQIMAVINAINLGEHGIGSGEDNPENQLEAMAEASMFNWRPGASRVMILLTDATAHEADGVTQWTVNNLLAERLLPNNVVVFPIFSISDSGQMYQYLPIAQQTNPNATYYDIYDNFNAIITEIGNYITSLYTVHYVSPVSLEDPMSRIVKLTATSGNFTSEDYTFYLPGISPIITREADLVALDHSSVPATTALVLNIKIVDRVPPGLVTQTLSWRRVGTSDWSSAPIVRIEEDFYRAIIPANQITGTGVQYYITASDGQTNVTLPSTEPELNPFSIAILPAAHANFGNPNATYNPGGPFSVSLTVTAPTALQLKLRYRPMGALVYSERVMNQTGNNFSAVVSQNLGSIGVQYYVVASQTNQLLSYLGNLDDPLYAQAGTLAPHYEPDQGLIQSPKAFPNPASASTRSGYVLIGFGLSTQASVHAEIYNLKGQKVRDLSLKLLDPGEHSMCWDINDDTGQRVPSGVYLYRLQADGQSTCGKLLITK